MEFFLILSLLSLPVSVPAAIAGVLGPTLLLSSTLVPVPITPMRLLLGYIVSILAAVAVAAFWEFLPSREMPEPLDTPEAYSRELWINFKFAAFFAVCVTLICVSVIDGPLTFSMIRRGFGSAASRLIASTLASLVIAILGFFALVALTNSRQMKSIFVLSAVLFAVRAIPSFGFNVSLGLSFLQAPPDPTNQAQQGLP